MSIGRRGKISALIVTTLIALTAVAGARGWFGGHHRMDPERAAAFVEDRFDDAMKLLDATEDQQARLKPLVDDVLAEGVAFMKTHGDLRDSLLAQWSAKRPDAEAVHAAIDARIEEMRALAHKAADAAISAHEVLTPEQRQQIADRVDRHRR